MSYVENDSSNDRCNGCGHVEHACRCGGGENRIWFGGDDVDVRNAGPCFASLEQFSESAMETNFVASRVVAWTNEEGEVEYFEYNALSEAELEGRTVKELKNILKKLKLRTSGRKADLVERLMNTGTLGRIEFDTTTKKSDHNISLF